MITQIFKKSKKKSSLVEPDEIFLDSKNLQNFDRQQFEGRIEKPIPKRTILFLGSTFIFVSLIFGSRLLYLQVNKGEAYLARSENNILDKIVIFADRGIIYDRNKKELAWNEKVDSSPVPVRSYSSPGFSHVLGYVSYPMEDKAGNYWQSEFVGKDGLEKEYNDKINGENGSKIIEINALGEIHSENIVNAPKRGDDLITTIDGEVQTQLLKYIKNLSESNSFTGGAGIIMDVENGEVIASTSFPEYNSEILSLGKNKEEINNYLNNTRKFFLDRVISGLYTPGSIIKPIFALGALAENVIDEHKEILSTGSISIPNPYFPDQKTVFKDWRVNGWTNMAEALAVSSDIYFYEIGGGFEDQKGLGILNLEKYAKLFGIGQPTGVDLPDETAGVIPSPEWKIKNFKNDPWRVGDTYNTAIGQYGFQVTPIEMVKVTSAIANYGQLLTPHFILGDKEKENKFSVIDLKKEYFDIVHDGMRQAVTYGTATLLNVPYVEVAAKTGTAQIGASKNKINSWVVGFFPYEKPKYAFTIMMESGPTSNTTGATFVMRQLLDWMSVHAPGYLIN